MTDRYPKLPFNELLKQSIKITGLSVSQFSLQSGIDLPDRFYRALKPNSVKLGIDTLHQISNRFPELNMDRFIRYSGPVLLSELSNPSTPPISDSTITSKSEEYFNAVIEGKDKEIARLEQQVAFMEKMLDKHYK